MSCHDVILRDSNVTSFRRYSSFNIVAILFFFSIVITILPEFALETLLSYTCVQLLVYTISIDD